jgi:uncharacterized membrane protein
MKNKLKIAGTIFVVIGFSITIYTGVLTFITPNYNLASTPKPPYWINPVAAAIVFAGSVLIFHRGKTTQTPS